MNAAKLKSVMVLHRDTNKNLAKFLGISEQSVSNKINENGTEFKQGEIAKIKDRYKLTPEDVETIFFLLKKCPKKTQRKRMLNFKLL